MISTDTSSYTTINKCLASGQLVQLLASDDSSVWLASTLSSPGGHHTNVVQPNHFDMGVEIQGHGVQNGCHDTQFDMTLGPDCSYAEFIQITSNNMGRKEARILESSDKKSHFWLC